MNSQIIDTMIKFNSLQTLLELAKILTHAAQDKFNDAANMSDTNTSLERIALGNAVIGVEQAIKAIK